jgi:hypothetical protein
LRFLDFLIHEPIRTVMLHRSGVPVTVPSPERYAVHKLIVASRRKSDANGVAKREKDVYQASFLVEAFKTTRRQDDLATAFSEAWGRGQHWREAILKGLGLLPPKKREEVEVTIRRALAEIGEELDGFTSTAK